MAFVQLAGLCTCAQSGGDNPAEAVCVPSFEHVIVVLALATVPGSDGMFSPTCMCVHSKSWRCRARITTAGSHALALPAFHACGRTSPLCARFVGSHTPVSARRRQKLLTPFLHVIKPRLSSALAAVTTACAKWARTAARAFPLCAARPSSPAALHASW